MVRVASSPAPSRGARTRSAILKNRPRVSRVPASPLASPTPHASGGMYLGGRTAPNTLAPTPITVPVPSSVPIAVLAWSPIRLPRLVRPVSIAAPATSSRIGPYVFFRLEVIVPAPRFTQRPITECPTKPSCALLAYPRKTHAASSPRTRQWGPIADERIGPPSSCVFAPTHSGPSSRVPARTSTPLSSTIGP